MRAQTLLLAVCSLFVVACGTPKAGDKCNTTGFLCADATTALECQSGAWVALPCRGSTGCAKANDAIHCDMSANVAGDACATIAEGKGFCNADGTGTLECHGGVLAATRTCRSCTVNGNNVDCTP
jgi:hypothetical protein